MTSIDTLWTSLDPTVQQWLLENPGTMVLPRTYVNRIETGTGKHLRLDDHGEHWLSPEEMVFLKTKRGEASRAHDWQLDVTGREAAGSRSDSEEEVLGQ